MDREVEKIIKDILLAELELPDTYGKDAQDNDIPSVVINNQNIVLGNTDKLQVVIGVTDVQVISNINRYDESSNEEIQEIIQRENIQIDLISENDDARTRRWEVVAALKSILSQQKQEEFYFRIFRIPSSFANTSETEGGSQLNKYSIIIPMNVWYRKTKTLIPQEGYGTHYDDFSIRVDDETTAGEVDGLIEFDIN